MWNLQDVTGHEKGKSLKTTSNSHPPSFQILTEGGNRSRVHTFTQQIAHKLYHVYVEITFTL